LTLTVTDLFDLLIYLFVRPRNLHCCGEKSVITSHHVMTYKLLELELELGHDAQN